jgi:hypothetical protein
MVYGASKEETTPLFSRRSGSQQLPDADGPRRRGAGTQVVSGSSNYPYSPVDPGKVDRRSMASRIFSKAIAFCCAKPTTDTQGTYYEDNFNDEPWDCTCGTSDQDGIWINNKDKVGTIMSSMVWVLIAYSCATISLLAQNNHLPFRIARIYITICSLALASHAKTTFTDPGSIPKEATPRAELFKRGVTTHGMFHIGSLTGTVRVC